jgi:signal transduction histidine kinase
VLQLEKTPDLLERLRAFDIFTEVADDALRWMIDKSTYVMYPKDSLIFRDQEEVDHMQILLSGGYKIIRETENRKRELGLWTAPQITGVLPFSRMKKTSAKGLCLKDTYALLLHRDCFVEMVNISYPLTQALVSVMTNRVRDFQQMRLMDEKLMALGKMSAGLAHELNNPASAMVRGSQELHRHLVQTPERFKSVITMRVSLDSVDAVNEVLFERIRNAKESEELSLMERDERTDELLDWLEDHRVERAHEMVDTFVDYDFGVEHFERMAAVIPEEAIGPVFGWIETNLTTETLVNEIQTASGRIAELVKSIKTYSHMDQEPSMELVDVHEGIKSTVTMLYHMIKKKNITLCKDLGQDLPRVKALAGELNQVWTNLLSNAIDALPDRGGQLIIRTFQEQDCVCVEVEDDGPGIPEDIQSRVFEPFFTTKGIGEGTGMGLDIVRRVIDHHNGSVNVDSRPGRTVFRVCFPTG